MPGQCIITGRQDVDLEMFDLEKGVNAANGYISVVALKDLARQSGMVDQAAADDALSKLETRLRAEFSERLEAGAAAETTLAALSADLEKTEEALEAERAKVAELQHDFAAVKATLRGHVAGKGDLEAEIEKLRQAVDVATAERDQAIAQLKKAPVPKRGPGRPPKAA